MHSFPPFEEVKELITLARREDLGASSDDVTSRLLIPEEKVGVGTLVQRDVGIVCGLPIVEMVCRAYDERLRVEQIPGFHLEIIEGRFSDSRTTPLMRVRGPLRALLSAERVMLNFLQHLSGVATMTHRFVRRVEGTSARILDTRKTLPGWRALEKYAVKSGGGMNHRLGLFDGVLIKDNHLTGVGLKDIASFLGGVVSRSRAEDAKRFIEVEVDTLEQLREVLKVDGVDAILLDNMDCPKMTQAVEMRNNSHSTSSGQANRKGKTALEASGGVTLDTVRAIAMTGVDRISVGALTHSAPALDIGLDIED
ncbi:MAG: carboxylating nicotinate-nucleotide diphosphorylase [Anaerolineae bacterium]|nr:carboxylating nicotinate-nucleotide diphosphorylase [Phycisphaerae bacterium]